MDQNNGDDKKDVEDLQREWFEQQKKDRENHRKWLIIAVFSVLIVIVLVVAFLTYKDQNDKRQQLEDDFEDSYSLVQPNVMRFVG